MTTLAEMALANMLRERLSAAFGVRVAVHALAPLHATAGPGDFRLEVELLEGPEAGHRTLALRGDRLVPTHMELSRAQEFEVVRAVSAAGVRTPTALHLLPDVLGRHRDAYLTSYLPGTASGPTLVDDPDYEVARGRIPIQLAESLAALHALTPAVLPELPVDRAPFLPTVDPINAQFVGLEAALDALDAPRPACEYVLRWLRRHPPVSREIVLVHGDCRTGNLLVTPDGLVALLDWECAHWGNPLEDLACLTLREGRFGRLDRPAGGFAELEPFLAAYVDLSGRPLRPADLHWWMVAGNLRRAVAALRASRGRGPAEVEHLALTRRAPELEFEAMRLIEVGP